MKEQVIIGIDEMRALVGSRDFYKKLPMFEPLRPKVMMLHSVLAKRSATGSTRGCSGCAKGQLLRMYGDILQHLRQIFVATCKTDEGKQQLKPLCDILQCRRAGVQIGGEIISIPHE